MKLSDEIKERIKVLKKEALSGGSKRWKKPLGELNVGIGTEFHQLVYRTGYHNALEELEK